MVNDQACDSMENKTGIHHFILTRFNLLLFNKDKEGRPVWSKEWLEHRFSLFEKYCFPSIANQTSKNFEWIVLFDSTTPERFQEKVCIYQQQCPQLIPVYVSPKGGQYFAQIFRDEVVKRLNTIRSDVREFNGSSSSIRVLTTYLDNDDALDVRFVEDIQKRSESLPDGTFIYYTQGYQFYTDHKYLMRVKYPRNHFVSVVENGNPLTVKTIYGYGSHYYIDKIKGAHIEYVKNQPMWCEVIHEKNMGNDAYFLNAKMIGNQELLRKDFAIDEMVQCGFGLFCFCFLPRYIKTFVRRIGYKLFGRHW